MYKISIHDIAFWICAFFLLGVFLMSFSGNILLILIGTFLAAVYLLFLGNKNFSVLVLAVLAGSFYYQSFGFLEKRTNLPLENNSEFTGVVQKVDQASLKQNLVLALEPPYSGQIRVSARPYPAFDYGDRIRLVGKVKELPPSYAGYYLSKRIIAISDLPKIEILEKNQGNYLKANLLKFKSRLVEVFQKILPSDKSALLAGITFGERSGFSKELENKMALSGTTHLVALSGYNISVIAWAAAVIFGAYFSRSVSFYLSVFLIVLFVLMTGAEASAVRAAIMGIIAILAKETERFFSVRNAIVIAAFLMILYNPNILVFDLGFQLSFAALLGIVYVLPALKKFFRMEDSGVLAWKENFLVTFSAQLAVSPILLGAFGKLPVLAMLPNVLIGWAIPYTMGLGFLIAGIGLFSNFLASVVGLTASWLLSYELWIIDFFSRFSPIISFASFGIIQAAAYYFILIWFVFYYGEPKK